MKNNLDDFAEILGKEFVKKTVAIAWAEVKEVDWQEKKMTVISKGDGLEYYDVLLGLEGKYLRPAVGAKVLIGIVEGSNSSILIASEELEECEFNIGDCVLKMNQSGFSLIKGGESLANLIDDLILELLKIIVIQGTSIDIPAVTTIQNRFKQLLN